MPHPFPRKHTPKLDGYFVTQGQRRKGRAGLGRSTSREEVAIALDEGEGSRLGAAQPMAAICSWVGDEHGRLMDHPTAQQDANILTEDRPGACICESYHLVRARTPER